MKGVREEVREGVRDEVREGVREKGMNETGKKPGNKSVI